VATDEIPYHVYGPLPGARDRVRWIKGPFPLPKCQCGTTAMVTVDAVPYCVGCSVGATLRRAHPAELLLLAIQDLYKEDPPGSRMMANGEPYSERWWFGTCESTVATAMEVGLVERFGGTPHWWGGFFISEAEGSHGHCWIDVGDWIVDATVGQFTPAFPTGWAIGPEHPERWRYTP
jgi:hypothetical protein